ncbi:C40 family peptidase [Deinococcus aerophilus]|uniref:Peptidase n=1 Tax=Deinococcus aerophilus TaxID=522488 RepID=A0ABQ2GQ65_9DEIO|nr:peptidoglycan endopeptidase [Deinococcus aerophilus]GGM07655.1 peptidase [Deinococcus aerophilus]
MLQFSFQSWRVSLLTTVLLACAASARAQVAPLPAQAVTVQTVTVQAGDTAYAIARRVGLRVETLLALNHLTAPDLKVGQVLLVQDPYRHSVQPGETLYALSRRYGVSVDALLAENLLPVGAVLTVGQVLKLPVSAIRPAAPVVAPLATAPFQPAQAPAASSNSQPLQTSSGGLPPLVLPTALSAPLRSAAGEQPALPTAALGPSWAAPEPLPAPPEALPALSSDWRSAALAMLDTPYVYGGTTRAGLDCSGFVLQVFTPLGVRLPRVSADQARTGLPVEAGQLQPGDLLFFDTEGRGRVSHVGIYLGDDTFVSANSYRGKVSIDALMTDRYWAPRYLGARRVLGTPYAQQAP